MGVYNFYPPDSWYYLFPQRHLSDCKQTEMHKASKKVISNNSEAESCFLNVELHFIQLHNLHHGLKSSRHILHSQLRFTKLMFKSCSDHDNSRSEEELASNRVFPSLGQYSDNREDIFVSFIPAVLNFWCSCPFHIDEAIGMQPV